MNPSEINQPTFIRSHGVIESFNQAPLTYQTTDTRASTAPAEGRPSQCTSFATQWYFHTAEHKHGPGKEGLSHGGLPRHLLLRWSRGRGLPLVLHGHADYGGDLWHWRTGAPHLVRPIGLVAKPVQSGVFLWLRGLFSPILKFAVEQHLQSV